MIFRTPPPDSSSPTFADWYDDPATGGTKYWDGSRWTGDKRPRRRPFAAASNQRDMGLLAFFLGLCFTALIILGVFSDDENDQLPVAALAFVPLILGVCGAIATYLIRGQGPATDAVEARLKKEQENAKKQRRTANLAGIAAMFGARRSPASSTDQATDVARINAIADPNTSRALQNLQNLLYTRSITDAEFEAAKAKLLGNRTVADSVAQIERLAELHRAGILSDLEFTAAKSRALDQS